MLNRQIFDKIDTIIYIFKLIVCLKLFLEYWDYGVWVVIYLVFALVES